MELLREILMEILACLDIIMPDELEARLAKESQ